VITEEETGRVERFVEMTRTFVVYKINAGIYLLGQHHCAHDVIGSAFCRMHWALQYLDAILMVNIELVPTAITT